MSNANRPDGGKMTAPIPSLAGADWLEAAPVRLIFAALAKGGEEARIVGGAVRNALWGAPVGEVDFATTATPDRITAIAGAERIKVVPTGVEHGTVTLVCHGQPYQVTTLRQDVATDGRHAVVRFGRDWEADARRRDFTVNALSVDAGGTVHDPVGGYGDILARHVRFIGDPDRRIAEDRLRILRFFRFNAEYGHGEVDRAGLAAAMRARNDVRGLSAERVGQEMRRLLVAPRAVPVLELMQEAGVLPVVLGGVGYTATLARVVAFEAALGRAPSLVARLTALACRIAEDALRVAQRLRLTNAERDAMLAALAAAPVFDPLPSARAARRALYAHGEAAYRDGVALAFAWGVAVPDDTRWRELATLPDRWTSPKFPLGGRDVLGQGASPSPAVGAVLKSVERWWIEQDFGPDETALRRRLQQLIAEQQCTHGHFASGGMDDRIEATLPPVFSPNTVPRS